MLNLKRYVLSVFSQRTFELSGLVGPWYKFLFIWIFVTLRSPIQTGETRIRVRQSDAKLSTKTVGERHETHVLYILDPTSRFQHNQTVLAHKAG